MSKNSLHSSGFALIETILAMALMIAFATTSVSVILHSFSMNRLGNEETQATLYAQEGIEAIRSIKNQNWSDLTPGIYGVDNSSGRWQLSGSPNTRDKFTRTIYLSEVRRVNTFCNISIVESGGIVDPDSIRVQSVASWDFSQTRNNQVELFTYLMNFKETSQSGSSQAGSVNLKGTTDSWKVQTQDNYAYIVKLGGVNDFVIVDISDPCAMTEAGTLNIPSTPQNVAVSGDYAYVASEHPTQELQIVDVSDPANPSVVGAFDADGRVNANGVFVDGTTVYLVRNSSSRDEFYAIDVSTASSPSLLDSLDLGATGYEVTVVGDYAFVATDSNSQELQVIDVSNPSSISLTSTLDLSGGNDTLTIAASGSAVIMGRQQTGSDDTFHVVDISTPTSPSLEYSTNTGDTINDVIMGSAQVASQSAYIVSDEDTAEFQIFDISDFDNISQVSTINLQADLNGLDYDPSSGLIYAVGDSDNEELVLIQPLL
jgi:Tfp pilus assembly protein PilV